MLALAVVCESAFANMPAGDAVLRRGFHQLYDMNFDGARQAFAEQQRTQPGDPRGHVAAAAAALFEEFHRLGVLESQFLTNDEAFLDRRKRPPNPAFREGFAAALKRAERLARERLEREPGNTDALFALTLTSGLQADHAALIEKRHMPALSHGRQAAGWAERLLAIEPECHDAYVSTGIAKYIVGALNAPLRWLLSIGGCVGSKQKGMAELGLAARNGRFLAPYARVLLAIAYVREGEKSRARPLLAGLQQEFPHNTLFRRELARLDTAATAANP